jgi:hypothetical protein
MRIIISIILVIISAKLLGQGTGMNLIPNERPGVKGDSVLRETDSLSLQEIRGIVFEKETRQPLSGAHIILANEAGKFSLISDENGRFTLTNVPIGRHSLMITYLGFNQVTVTPMVSAFRKIMIEVPMEVAPMILQEVQIKGEFSLSPDLLIDPNEISHHAGRPEAIRKVSVFPGIQGADDSRNDIVVRGNSPQSVVYRMEGINIPNPNHFNIPGTSGGPVSLISDKVLGLSNFYSGAFQSEFGNTTSAVFDLHLRNGDTTSHVSSIQVGLLGAEITAEGPISKKNQSSYLVNFRRSIIGLFQKLPIDIGTNSLPIYSDLSFKLNFPLKDKSTLWLFGLGGQSKIDILIDTTVAQNNIYGEKDRDQYLRSSTSVIGIGYNKTFKKNRYLFSSLAFSSEKTYSNHYLVYYNADLEKLKPQPDSTHVLHYDFRNQRISAYLNYSVKVKRGNYINAGISNDLILLDHVDSLRNITMPNSDSTFGEGWRRRLLGEDHSFLIQPFVQWKFTAKRVQLITGVHGQYYSMSKSKSVEPRMSVTYILDTRSKLNMAYGHHSQAHQPYIYLHGSKIDNKGNPILENKNIDFTRSRHFTFGYETKLGSDSSNWRLRIESYYQYLYNVPVERDSINSYSLINTGADYTRPKPNPLTNTGIGKNYGLEITVDKSFSKGYLFLLTGSLFESKYKGSDNVLRNTDFNARYTLNVLTTKEWLVAKRKIISLGIKFTTTGGRWYGPIDSLESEIQRDPIYISEYKNTSQFRPYYRVDFRIVYKSNRNYVNHELSLDFINAFNIKNILKYSYFPVSPQGAWTIKKEYQLGFLPFFYYRVDIKKWFRL